jgi:spermidine synthase
MAWLELAQARLPNGDVLTLRRCGADFEIRCNLFELMSSRNPVSETALAQLTCAGAARVLIGGLGMGYTLRAVLDQLDPNAAVTVAELVPEVIAWNRGPLAVLAGHPLDDRRVTVCEGDIAEVIRANPGTFDVILMDVDNGPEAVLFPANQVLYEAEGVELILSALRPGGVLGLWAADRSANFERVIAGFPSERVDIGVLGNDGPAHTIYLVRARD